MPLAAALVSRLAFDADITTGTIKIQTAVARNIFSTTFKEKNKLNHNITKELKAAYI